MKKMSIKGHIFDKNALQIIWACKICRIACSDIKFYKDSSLAEESDMQLF